jgi:hypothetical protein
MTYNTLMERKLRERDTLGFSVERNLRREPLTFTQIEYWGGHKMKVTNGLQPVF